MFKVSVKGIAATDGRYLLRVNERGDYELLGGKLEQNDATLADRVRQEFLEESGVVVEPTRVREPWFYVFGDQAVLIVPMTCEVTSVPKTLFDQDGGRLEWVEANRLDTIRLPKSYLASIRGERPHLLRYGGKPGLPYPDDRFCVELVVRCGGNEECHSLNDACDFAEAVSALGYPKARFCTVRYQGGHVCRWYLTLQNDPLIARGSHHRRHAQSHAISRSLLLDAGTAGPTKDCPGGSLRRTLTCPTPSLVRRPLTLTPSGSCTRTSARVKRTTSMDLAGR